MVSGNTVTLVHRVRMYTTTQSQPTQLHNHNLHNYTIIYNPHNYTIIYNLHNNTIITYTTTQPYPTQLHNHNLHNYTTITYTTTQT